MALSPLRNLFPTIIFGEKTLQPPEASAHIWTPILWTQFPGKHRGHGKAAILVKSYANAALDIEATALNSIMSPLQIGLEVSATPAMSPTMPSFFSSEASTTGSHDYEIMIWLASYGGATPIGYTAGSVTTMNESSTTFSNISLPSKAFP
ncbi:Mss4-like protein [Penicillium atrosanguineum]|uniref:Mss4-like protein n=1 Tax=Penicillium atrosanguineum TaxID=1132637 RepID=UPI00239E35D9|nr:Mss4-like protein [Penicillium atrosanguineum]KAJ5313454.1 Mss4-like protein [Penicillium atrosanguineum]